MQSIWAGVPIAGIRSHNIGGNCIPELRAQCPFRGLNVRPCRLRIPTYVRRACMRQRAASPHNCGCWAGCMMQTVYICNSSQ